jgi:hypothetical protein
MLATRVNISWGYWGLVGGILLLCWGVLPAGVAWARAAALGLASLCLAAGLTAWRFAPLTPEDMRYLPAGMITLAGYPLETPTVTDFGWHLLFHVVARQARWLDAGQM